MSTRARLPQVPDLQIRLMSTTALKSAPHNPRTHPEAQIKAIMRSITEFGFTNPIGIDDDGNVVYGHGRLEAAIRLGLTKVPVVTLSHLTKTQLKAYLIADNALAEKAGWSKKLLAAEIRGLIEVGYEVELTGLDTIEIDTLLNMDEEEPDSAGRDEEKVELPSDGPPITQLGDHWVVGQQQWVCGDARNWACYEKLLGGERAQVAFLDPPYNCLIAGHVSGLGAVRHENFVMAAGELTDAEFTIDFLRPVFRNLVLACAPGAIAYVCSDWRAYPSILDAASGVFAEQKNLAIFAKTNAGMGSFYRSQTELIPIFKVSKGPTINNFQLGQGGRHRSNLWTYAGCNTFRRGRDQDLSDHPTVKPRKLVADAILDTSRRGGIVIDPFLGSGTTLAACEVTGRRGFGLELDPHYCDVILRRLQALTGEMPRLADGTPFDEVAAQREAKGEEG